MELLVWHDALGCDDEQAGDAEVAQRLLYHARSASAAAAAERERPLDALRFLQGVVAFARSLGSASDCGCEWTSVRLDGLAFLVAEVEPQVCVALGAPISSELGEHRVAFQALVRGLHDAFRLFHGSIDSNLRFVVGGNGSDAMESMQCCDGMDVLFAIQAAMKRVRKLRQRIEVDDSDPQDGFVKELGEAEEELRVLETRSPIPRLRRLFDQLFPTMLETLEAQSPSCFSELNGFGYFPMDQPLFLDVQTFVSGLRMHLEEDAMDSCALFYRGNLLWSSEDLETVRGLYAFLRLREEAGMRRNPNYEARTQFDDIESEQARGGVEDSIWLGERYRDTFLPVWSSKASYTECEVAGTSANTARKTARSIHKLAPRSLAGLLGNESGSPLTASLRSKIAISADEKPPSPPLTSLKARLTSVSFRNSGLLLQNGYFARPSELPRPKRSHGDLSSLGNAPDIVWNPTVFSLSSATSTISSALKLRQPALPRRVIMRHESGLSILVLFRSKEQLSEHQAPPRVSLSTLDKLDDYLNTNDRFSHLASLILSRYLDTVTRTSSGGLPRQSNPPPFIYLNRVNMAFKLQQVPRLLRTSEDDLFPVPVGLVAHYFPQHSLELVNQLHSLLEQSAGNHDLCVRTRRDGWVYAKKSRTSHRDLFVFLDSRVPSVADLTHALNAFLNEQFGNVFF